MEGLFFRLMVSVLKDLLDYKVADEFLIIFGFIKIHLWKRRIEFS